MRRGGRCGGTSTGIHLGRNGGEDDGWRGDKRAVRNTSRGGGRSGRRHCGRQGGTGGSTSTGSHRSENGGRNGVKIGCKRAGRNSGQRGGCETAISSRANNPQLYATLTRHRIPPSYFHN